MNLGTQSMSAVIRAGDYFVVSNDRDGNKVQYSPDAVPGAPIVGAFGSCRGVLVYKDAEETARLVAVKEGSIEQAEHAICREVELLRDQLFPARTGRPNGTSTDTETDDVVRLVQATAAMAREDTPNFQGNVAALLQLLGVDLPAHKRQKLVRRLAREFPIAVSVSQGSQSRGPGSGSVVHIEWLKVNEGAQVDGKI